MRLSTTITASALSAVALAGLLAGCDKKASDSVATPATTGSAVAPAASDAAGATSAADDANQDARHGPGMSDNMAERHRQDMDHDTMRRGGPMGPAGAAPAPTPTSTPAPSDPPMKDM